MIDTKKFLIMTQEFPSIYTNAQEFAKKLGQKRDNTINNWVNCRTSTINPIYKAKIIELFNLPHDVWMINFNRDESFREYLKDLKEKEKDRREGNFDDLIVEKLPKITTKEKNMLQETLKQNINLEEIKDTTPSFMFEYAIKLQKEKKIEEALKVLTMIENNPSSYKSTYYNKIEKFKAILLSDDKIKDWDGAIHILKKLYSSAKYHLDEPELTTLIASNYKRKAFYSHNKKSLVSKDEVDMDLLVAAIAIHKESYKVKDSKDKYYDAINMAYLYNILNAIEDENSNKTDINQLYIELSQVWKINDNDWWATISNSEFLMLLGQVDLAISKIDTFLEWESENLTPSEIKATFRQLEIYIHFTKDQNAINFYKHLNECWEALK